MAPYNMNPKKILVADDNIFVRNSTKHTLAREGFEIIEAEDGLEAVEKIIETKPDVIVMDLAMPKLDGFGVLSAIRSNPDCKNIPFIIITAHATKDHVVMGKQLGVYGFLAKPFNISELTGIVRKALGMEPETKPEETKSN